MNAFLTVYFNTGFSLYGNIPATPAVLELASKKTYPAAYYIREDIDKPVLRVMDSYNNLCDVDYAKIESYENNVLIRTSYYFAYPRSLNQGVTALSLDLDALLTMGGCANLTYTSGWQTRGHISKQEDALFSNTASEEWMPSKPLRMVGISEIERTGEQPANLNIVLTNTDFDSVYDSTDPDTIKVVVGVDGTRQERMSFPKIDGISYADSTFFSVWDDQEPNQDPSLPPGASKTFRTPGTAAYDITNPDVVGAMTNLFSAGQLQLSASYTIPGMYVGDRTSQPSASGLYGRIDGHYQVTPQNTHPFEYVVPNYTVKNKKCYQTYRHFVIVNLASGDMSKKMPHEIYDGQSQYPSVKMWADPTSTGKPYARFAYIVDNPLQWADTVKGLQWANAQLLLEGASGSMWNSINNAFKSQSLQRSQMESELKDQFNADMLEFETSYQIGEEQSELNYQYGTNEYSKAPFVDIGAGTTAMGGPGMSADIANALTAGRQIKESIDSLGRRASWFTSGYEADRATDTATRKIEYLRDKQQRQRANSEANTSLARAAHMQAVNENALNLAMSNNLVAPTVMFTPEQNLGLYGYNRFVMYEVRKTDEDLKSEDEYYQRYGYSGLHRPLTKDCFNVREYYTYVQAFDVNIQSNFGLRVRQKGIAQLNAGVRVWKVLPNATYYETN